MKRNLLMQALISIAKTNRKCLQFLEIASKNNKKNEKVSPVTGSQLLVLSKFSDENLLKSVVEEGLFSTEIYSYYVNSLVNNKKLLQTGDGSYEMTDDAKFIFTNIDKKLKDKMKLLEKEMDLTLFIKTLNKISNVLEI